MTVISKLNDTERKNPQRDIKKGKIIKNGMVGNMKYKVFFVYSDISLFCTFSKYYFGLLKKDQNASRKPVVSHWDGHGERVPSSAVGA